MLIIEVLAEFNRRLDIAIEKMDRMHLESIIKSAARGERWSREARLGRA